MTRPRAAARRAAAVAAGAALCALAAACGDRDAPSYPPRTPTPGTATLPETPDLNPPPTPTRYDDGAYTVAGLLADKEAAASAEPVLLRGTVAALHSCPDRDKGCKPAPHLLLTDAADMQGRRLLVGGNFDAARDGYKVGEVATVRGRKMTSSPDGLYFAPGGMLLLEPPAAPDADAAP